MTILEFLTLVSNATVNGLPAMNNIGDTTDVVLVCQPLQETKIIDAGVSRGWFADDFTLAEIKTPESAAVLASAEYDRCQFEVPYFARSYRSAKGKVLKLGEPSVHLSRDQATSDSRAAEEC